MFLSLTRVRLGAAERDDTDAPFLVNFDHVKFVNRDKDYQTVLTHIDRTQTIVEESVGDIMDALDEPIDEPLRLRRVLIRAAEYIADLQRAGCPAGVVAIPSWLNDALLP